MSNTPFIVLGNRGTALPEKMKTLRPNCTLGEQKVDWKYEVAAKDRYC